MNNIIKDLEAEIKQSKKQLKSDYLERVGQDLELSKKISIEDFYQECQDFDESCNYYENIAWEVGYISGIENAIRELKKLENK